MVGYDDIRGLPAPEPYCEGCDIADARCEELTAERDAAREVILRVVTYEADFYEHEDEYWAVWFDPETENGKLKLWDESANHKSFLDALAEFMARTEGGE